MSRLILLCALYIFSLPSHGQYSSVLFLNPGKAEESFWSDVDHFAKEAAKQLLIDLDIVHGEREEYTLVNHLQKLIARRQLPDYLILVNEKQVLPRLMTLLEGHPVYIVIILNDLSQGERTKAKLSAHWEEFLLTTLIPDNYWIGQQTAKEMVLAGGQQAGDLLVLSGDKLTPASIQRTQGALDYVKHNTQLTLKQVVYTDWNEQQAYSKTMRLLKRFPQSRYIWTVNDHSALGAIKALNKTGLTPGKDVYIATVNSSAEIIQRRQQGEISSLGAGHFALAGWALLLIDRHSKGSGVPKRINRPFFELINENSPIYQCLIDKDWSRFPFRQLAAQDSLPTNFQLNKQRLTALP
ncbi:ABC transporter substrate-binding protein [Aliagarivorans taiwanensis]|uniref:ABC transporter substrate-binding protein n=1 Tax=Aliagarivorans taiwanensis TaxID=561966 RepID=UPI000A00CF6B|nr:ABC transporter substrate-binding protein [Aliagarivorans taiwanensis]